jgi:hypothetical protein
MNSLFSSSTENFQNSDVKANTINILNQALDFSFFQNSTSKLLIIPSLNSSSTSYSAEFLHGATTILSNLRREIDAWCSKKKQNSSDVSVFWALIVAHTSSFENGKHFDSSFAWLIPLIASCAFKFEQEEYAGQNQKMLRSAIQHDLIQKIFSPSSTTEDFVQKIMFASSNQEEFVCESISGSPQRWIGLAYNFLKSNNFETFFKSSSDQFLWQLSTTIVQSLLAVWVPNRGIFIDRIKCVVSVGGGEQNSSSSSSSSTLIHGVLLPFSLGLESQMTFEFQRKVVSFRAICFSCSLIDFEDENDDDEEGEDDNCCDQDILIEFLKSNQISVLICQRLIPAWLKIKLAKRAQVISIDRLGIAHFPKIVQVLGNPAVVHRFDKELFQRMIATGKEESSSDDKYDEEEEEEEEQDELKNERNLFQSRCIVKNVKLWKEENEAEEEISPIWIGLARENSTLQNQNQNQQPSVVSIFISTDFDATTTKRTNVESIVLFCVKHVSQILVDDITIRAKNNTTRSAESNFSAVQQVSATFIRSMISFLEKQKHLTNSIALHFLKIILKELTKNRQEKYNEQTISSFSEESKKMIEISPPCVRVSTVRDAFLSGFELAQQLISISKCV